jgi:hypothetical protein
MTERPAGGAVTDRGVEDPVIDGMRGWVKQVFTVSSTSSNCRGFNTPPSVTNTGCVGTSRTPSAEAMVCRQARHPRPTRAPRAQLHQQNERIAAWLPLTLDVSCRIRQRRST